VLTESDLLDAARETAAETGLHQSVARIAALRPDAIAVRCGPRAVSYAELDRTADAWAARLPGAGTSGIVPILLPRGIELVTALLAVLKTGAGYALLDPAWPSSRIGEVVRQLGARVLITDDPSAVLDLDQPVTPWTPPCGPVEPRATFRPAEVGGDAVCCVFFTSGTTGRPKGVLSPHRATARLFGPDGFARFDSYSVVPLAAPVPWDAFSLELWAALLNGGCSLIIEEPYLSAAGLRSAAREHGADTVWLTSSLFNMMVDEDLEAFAGLDQVMTGGERLSAGHVCRFLDRYPEITLLNGYGPVESTVFATTHRITPADCAVPDGIPVGRAVPRTGVHILDGSRTCAADEVGEICISGDGLALGYLGDPELTADKFPVLAVDGVDTRVYRTGDLGYRDADGVIRYRGRADRQVKIRGHRVEPAEVERGIERLPAVRACRVVARRDDAGAVRELLAFCVPAEPGDRLEQVAPALTDLLPAYQCPAAVISVPSFPLTAQGKLDERTLLELIADAPTDTSSDADADAITDPMEQLVAEVFRDVLEVRRVPGDASFFDLGGTSLAAGRVCARLSERLGRTIALSAIYGHPSVRELAAWLKTHTTDQAPTDDSAPVPLTPMQLVYLARQLSDPDDRTAHCLLTWVLDGPLDLARLQAAVNAVHQRHEPLRTAYLVDPRPIAEPTDIEPPLVETLPGESSVDQALCAVRAVLAEDLDPTEADVWRVVLAPVQGSTAHVLPCTGARTTHVLGCVVHHIAFDGWSEAVLANELSAAYNGDELPPEPPTIAALHRNAPQPTAADEAASREQVRDELAGVPDLTWLSTPDAEPNAHSGVIAIELPARVLSHIDAVASEARVSRFAVLFSRWAAVLAETTGQDDFAVGVPVARREQPGVENAIGCHIAVLCLRVRGEVLRGGTDGALAASQTYANALAAQDLPFAELLRAAGARSTGRPPLFQTMFALQDNAVPHLPLDGLASSFVRQSYLDVPLELHGELWPTGDGGGLLLTVFHRPEAVAEADARRIAERFTDFRPPTRKA